MATGGGLVIVSSQEPEDITGKLVCPDESAVQAHQVFANLGRAPATAGAKPDQVSKITIWLVNYDRDGCLPIVEAARQVSIGCARRELCANDIGCIMKSRTVP